MSTSPAAETAILRLISSGAMLEEIAEHVAAARAAAGPGDRRRFDALLDAAAELYRARGRDRREHRGLAAVNDTAADLATRRNLDEVLAAICRRARVLIDCDAAYITLRDEVQGDTYVRATDGIVSEDFRRMRLPLGVGLGGLVAREGIPATTSDYTADPRFSHVAEVDRRVTAEGLRAIVGVPLLRDSGVIGVLMAGARSVRRFAPSEVALFQTLATHAAIAIENARLLEEIRERNSRAEAAAALNARLAALVVEGAGPAELVEALREVVGGRLELAAVDGGAEDDPVATASDTVAVVVAAGAEHLGTLLWAPAGPVALEPAVELLERGAVIIAGQLLAHRAVTEADLRRRSELVADLFDKRNVDPDSLARVATRLGLALETPHVVVVAEIPRSAERWTGLRAARAAIEAGGAARTLDARVVAVIPGADPHRTAREWTRFLGSNAGAATIGVSRCAVGLANLREAHAEATNVLGLLNALEREGTAATADDVGIFGLVFGRAQPADIAGFVSRRLGPIFAYDESRPRAILLPTLETYLAHGGRLSTTARALGIHVNTLYSRLERVDDLLSPSWREPDGQLELRLALRLRTLAGRLDAG